MNIEAFKHKLLSAEEANARFKLSEYINAYSPENDRLPVEFLLIEGDVDVAGLSTDDVSDYAPYLIIDGNLKVSGAIEIFSAEGGLDGLMVTGDLHANTLTMGDTYIVVLGSMQIDAYLHTPEPDYESGELYVRGPCQIPFIVQEADNPELNLPNLSSRAWVTPENTLHTWPAKFFGGSKKNYVDDIAGLVAHIDADMRKPPEEQSHFDWWKHLGFNPKRYGPSEKLHRAAWLHGAQTEIDEPPFGCSLAQLKSIEICDMPLVRFPAVVLGSASLEELNLDNCFTNTQEFPDLSGLQQLRRLRLCGNVDKSGQHAPAQPETVRRFLQMPFVALDFLELDYWHASADGKWARRALCAEDLQGIGQHQHLRGVAFYNNGLTDLPDDFFDLKELRFLRLIENISPKLKKKIKQKFPCAKIVL